MLSILPLWVSCIGQRNVTQPTVYFAGNVACTVVYHSVCDEKNRQLLTSLEVSDDASDAVETTERVEAGRSDRTYPSGRQTFVHVCQQ